MYRIYADDELLYSPEVNLQEYKLTEAKFTTEVNKAGSFEFTMPPTHRLYSKLQHLKTDISIKYTQGGDSESTRFHGRVLNNSKDFNNRKQVYCEGDLAILNDTVIRPFNFVKNPKMAFYTFINMHNAQMNGDEHRQFEIGECDMTTTDTAYDASSFGSYIYTDGRQINHTVTSGAIDPESDLSWAQVGWLYLNRFTYQLYKCIMGGTPDTAIWAYLGNVQHYIGYIDNRDWDDHWRHVASGNEITGTSRDIEVYSLQDIESPKDGDIYINNETLNVYHCLIVPENGPSKWFYYNTLSSFISNADKKLLENAVYFSSTNYISSWELFNNSLLGNIGGYLYTTDGNRSRKLNWTKTFGSQGNQVIKFGTNLLDLSEHISAENIITRIIPIGGDVTDEDGNSLGTKVTIQSVNNGLDYIEDYSAIRLFGYVTKCVEFSSITTPEELYLAASAYLQEAMCLAVSIELTAFDLSTIDVDADDIIVGNSYRVVSEPHGIDEYFVCSKAEIDILKPDQSRFTFGVNRLSLTGITASNSNYITTADTPRYIKQTDLYWMQTDSSTEAPDKDDTEWSTTRPEWVSGYYIWQKTVNTYSDDTIEELDPVCVTGSKGEDAVNIYLHSTNGVAFKNNAVSTVLTVTIYYGSITITDQTQLETIFGSGSYLQWQVKTFGSSSFVTIPSSDPRFANDCFTFTLSPEDVDTQVVFNVQVIVPD